MAFKIHEGNQILYHFHGGKGKYSPFSGQFSFKFFVSNAECCVNLVLMDLPMLHPSDQINFRVELMEDADNVRFIV